MNNAHDKLYRTDNPQPNEGDEEIPWLLHRLGRRAIFNPLYEIS